MELLAEGIFYAVTSSLVLWHSYVIMFNKTTQFSSPFRSWWGSAIFIRELELLRAHLCSAGHGVVSTSETGVSTWGRSQPTLDCPSSCSKHCSKANLEQRLPQFGRVDRLHWLSSSFIINERNHQFIFQISALPIFSAQWENDWIEVLLVNERISFILCKVSPVARKKNIPFMKFTFINSWQHSW